MPLFGEIKRTYSKKQEQIPVVPKGLQILEGSDGKENFALYDFDSSLDKSCWKDSFDKLLEEKKVLRQKNVIKKKINASYNRDSSKERDSWTLPDLIKRKKRRGRMPVKHDNKRSKKTQGITEPNKPRRKRKKLTHMSIGGAIVSTPVWGKKSKQTSNLLFNMSPIQIATPVMKRNDSSDLKILSRPTNNSPLKFFGRPRVQINLDNSSIKELMKSYVKAVNESNKILTGKSIIEISHTEDEMIESQILQKTNPETLISLALLPKDSIPEILEKSMKDDTSTSIMVHMTRRCTANQSTDSRIRSNSPDFRGFNETSIAKPVDVSCRISNINGDIRTNVTTFPPDVKNSVPERISLNYLTKTLEIVEEDIDTSLPTIKIDPPCNRNDITRGFIDLTEDYPECNHHSKTISPQKLDTVPMDDEIPEISSIPTSPIFVTKRQSRRRTTKIPERLSVMKETIPDQRRVTRRMTKKVVQFNETPEKQSESLEFHGFSDSSIEKPRLNERKTVQFEHMSDETSTGTIHLAPGKWRKSLAAWKRKTLAGSTTNSHFDDDTRLSRGSKISRMRKSNGNWLSTVGRMAVQEENEDNELVLEPTTDETYNLSELSLRDSEEDSDQEEKRINCRESSSNNTGHAELQRSHSYIDESRRHRSLYRRQLSTRLRKTSVYEHTFISAPPGYYSHPANDLLLILPKLTARDVVLRLCKQSEPQPFNEIYSAAALRCCRKIGEGVYSEVFMYKSAQGRTVVLKVIPVEGAALVNGEPQKRFDEIQSEIVIAQEVTNLRYGDKYMTEGFVEAVNVRCVQGRYPDHLIDLWELYDENRTSDNDHPELFKDDQLFIVLELANSGQDLEAFQFDNALQSHSAFLQVAITLAIAEKRLEFEHRDLHWGNVLLSNTDAKHITFKIDGKSIEIPTHGVKATIIDFTLSRMVANGVRLYNDLAQDDELFSASGDYQFDIYRLMKSRLDNCWERFEPYTNLLWLHYLVDKMINGARYKNSKSRKHRTAVDQLMQLRDELLEYKSAADYVQNNYA